MKYRRQSIRNESTLNRLAAWTLIAAFGASACATGPVSNKERAENFYLDDEADRAPARVRPLGVKGEDVIRAEIYKKADWLKLVFPLSPFLPRIAVGELKKYVNKLPLEKDVRARVMARLESKALMDQIVPFLALVKDHYFASEEETKRNFQSFIDGARDYRDTTPGFKHSMFTHSEQKKLDDAAAKAAAEAKAKEEGGKEEEKKGGFKLDSKFAAALVTFYDAIFLKFPGRTIGNKPAAIGAKSASDRQVVAEVVPLARKFLEEIGASSTFKDNEDVQKTVHFILKEDNRIEALTISLVKLIEIQVSKHYEMFARKVKRSQDLESWLIAQINAEADGKGDGKLAAYLKQALEGRRYGVHVIVDGLQGHMTEALSKGEKGDPFLAQAWKDIQEGEKISTGSQESEAVKTKHQTSFLKNIAENGYYAADYMLFFKSLYDQNPGTVAKVGVSSTPTISVRNLPIVMTGARHAGPHSIGLPNFHYLDRTGSILTPGHDRAYYFFGNDALLFDEITQRHGLINMFTRLENYTTLNCNSQHDRGAQWFTDALVNLGVGEKKRDFGDILCLNELESRARTEVELLKPLREKLLWLVDRNGEPKKFQGKDHWQAHVEARELARKLAALEDEGMPQYVQYYNPWPDHFAHFKGPFSDEIISLTGEYNRLSFWLREITDLYKRAGLYDRTLFGMAGDHGLGPIFRLLNPETVVFGKPAKEGSEDFTSNLNGVTYKFRVKKISSDEGEGPKMNHPWKPSSNRGYDVLVASTAGGNYMLDFFKDHKSRKKWVEQPVTKELEQLTLLSGQKIDIIQTMAESLSESLDYMLVRDTPTGVQGGSTRVVAIRDGKRADAVVHRKGSVAYYEMSDGVDVLGVKGFSPYDPKPEGEGLAAYQRLLDKCVEKAKKDNASTWCSEVEWRELTSYTGRQDSVVQVSHIYDSDLPGTVNLFPKKGIGYNTKVPGRHAGETFHEKDAFVGFWGGAARTGGPRIRTAENGVIAPTIYEWITKRRADKQPGFGYPSFLMDVLK